MKSTTICIESLVVIFHFWGRYGLKTENIVEFSFQKFLNDQYRLSFFPTWKSTYLPTFHLLKSILKYQPWAHHGHVLPFFLFNMTYLIWLLAHSVSDYQFKLTYHWTCHANTDIFYYKSSGLSPTISKHNALMLSKLQMDINPWLLVGLPCVIHHWKGLLNQIQVNQVSSLNLKSESLHLPLANSISSFYSSSESFLFLQPYFYSWIAFGRHLLRNYKSYNSATWHKHSPISEDAHATFCSPLYKTMPPSRGRQNVFGLQSITRKPLVVHACMMAHIVGIGKG